MLKHPRWEMKGAVSPMAAALEQHAAEARGATDVAQAAKEVRILEKGLEYGTILGGVSS